MNKNTKIKIRNRSTGSLSYKIPDMNNFTRTFAAGETKELPFEEVQKLAYIPGGDYMLQHFLVIDNIEARNEILGEVELEYDYTQEDVKNLLEHGTMDELLDCLDFAPAGVIDLVKSVSVQIELNDMKKREIIFKKLGFNVSNAVAINKETDESITEEKATARRVNTTPVVENTSNTPVRRVVKKQ